MRMYKFPVLKAKFQDNHTVLLTVTDVDGAVYATKFCFGEQSSELVATEEVAEKADTKSKPIKDLNNTFIEPEYVEEPSDDSVRIEGVVDSEKSTKEEK